MTVINESRPFNVGDRIDYLGTLVSVSSWRPDIDVHALDTRGRSVTIPWHVAEQRKVTR